MVASTYKYGILRGRRVPCGIFLKLQFDRESEGYRFVRRETIICNPLKRNSVFCLCQVTREKKAERSAGFPNEKKIDFQTKCILAQTEVYFKIVRF